LREDDLESALHDAYRQGQSITGARYIEAINKFHETGRRLTAYMEKFDMVLTPSLAALPAPLGFLSMGGTFWELRRKVSRYAPFQAFVNAAGVPAVSLPLYATAAGVPVGTQLIAKFGRDDLLLAVAAELEAS
jgi:amidase